MSRYANLKIQSMPMQFNLDADQKRHDLDIGFARGIPINLLTEIDTPIFGRIVEAKAEQHGLRVVAPVDPRTNRRSHEPIAVSRSLPITSFDYREIIAPGVTSGKKHGPRGITTVRVKWKGNIVSASNAHFLTDWNDPKRYQKNMLLLDAMADRMERDARGSRLAFGGADLNWDVNDASPNDVGEIIRKRGLMSVFEALGHPNMPTHGSRTIDIQWFWTGDTRVTPMAVRTIQNNEVFTYKDHDDVIGTYRVRLPNEPSAA